MFQVSGMTDMIWYRISLYVAGACAGSLSGGKNAFSTASSTQQSYLNLREVLLLHCMSVFDFSPHQ